MNFITSVTYQLTKAVKLLVSLRTWTLLIWTNWSSRLWQNVRTWKMQISGKCISITAPRKFLFCILIRWSLVWFQVGVLGLCVLKASVVECWPKSLINTLDWHLDHYWRDIPIDMQSTLDQHLINSGLKVSRVSTNSCAWSEHLSTKMLMEC